MVKTCPERKGKPNKGKECVEPKGIIQLKRLKFNDTPWDNWEGWKGKG